MRRMFAMAAMVVGFSCAVADAAETELVSPQTVWRVWMATGPRVSKAKEGQTVVVRPGSNPPAIQAYNPQTAFLTELPPAGWSKSDCDDSIWVRYGEELFERVGGFGCRCDGGGGHGAIPAALYLRTRFGVSDPAKAVDLKVAIEYLGGAVVYVNGVEVGRSNLPEGAIDPYSLANDYPIEAYTTEDGRTPLPGLSVGMKPEPKWASRYQTRVRRLAIDVPARVLVKGANVLAVELHRAAVCGPSIAWGHVGIRAAKMASPSGEGVIGYADALKGTRVWSAQAMEQIAEKCQPTSKINAGQTGWSGGSGQGAGIIGISTGNPLDSVTPIRILVPRNGIGNGMAVLSDFDGLRGVVASVKDFTGPGGAVLPAKWARVRFAEQAANYHCCDTLLEKAPDGVKTLPVWLEVKAPRDQAPGWYVSSLSLEANGKKFQVPVQVFATGYIVPDSKDFRSLVGVMHSPEVAAKIARTTPWSDAHFAMMAKSLEAAGQLGNDIMYVPVVVGDHMGHQTGLIRWTKTSSGLQPDFTAFEKYLDLYLKYCAPPRAIILYVWTGAGVKEVATAYESGAAPTREVKGQPRPLHVTQWDSTTGTNTALTVPSYLDEGAEAFWKPMLDGVHSIVLKRGWSERVIMVGTGSDGRPSQKTGELFRQWAPYARWDIYSHFSGDPPPGVYKQLVGGNGYHGAAIPGMAPGKQFAVGNLEVGVKESPGYGEIGLQKLDFLAMPIRGITDDVSPPMAQRMMLAGKGRWGRLGLDFWPGDVAYHRLIWGSYPQMLMSRSEAGPVPTVRLQMLREGCQDFEPRLTIMEAIGKLPVEEQKPHQSLLNDFNRRQYVGHTMPLSQVELNLDWPAHLARTYRAAEELTGIKTDATWEQPPK